MNGLLSKAFGGLSKLSGISSIETRDTNVSKQKYQMRNVAIISLIYLGEAYGLSLIEYPI